MGRMYQDEVGVRKGNEQKSFPPTTQIPYIQTHKVRLCRVFSFACQTEN